MAKTKKENDHQYYLRHRVRCLSRCKEYYKRNAEVMKARARQWYLEHRDSPDLKKRIERVSKKHYLKNRDESLLYHKTRWAERRMILINYFGGKCEKCGFTDYRALQIDHIGGGGVRESRSNIVKDQLKYLERIKMNRSKYQLLCANCNWIKKYENNENAQKRIA